MKKSKSMRLASALLVLTLLSTCMISGTFAKYTTSASGTDTARVAKFGVEVTASTGTAFATQYEKNDTTYSGSLTVQSSDENKVVAPGTSSADVNGDFKFTIKGTPEVAVKVELETENTQDVFLKAGTYTDWTVSPYNEKFTLEEDYYPVKWTLAVTDNNVEGEYTGYLIEKATLAEVEDAVLQYVSSYEPNTQLDAEFTLTWAWDFEGNDKADTLLGNIAAGTENDVVDTNYGLETAFDFTITVTQID